MPPGRLEWGATLRDGPRRFWRRSATVARRLPQTAAHNDEKVALKSTDLVLMTSMGSYRSGWGAVATAQPSPLDRAEKNYLGG